MTDDKLPPDREDPVHEDDDNAAATDSVDGRDRLKSSLRKPMNRGQVVVAVLLAILGFGAAVQVQSNSQDNQYVGARQDELINLINSLSLASQRTENEIAELLQTRNSLLNDTEARRTALEQARQLADQLGILAGTTPAVGPGVRVTVTDPNGTVGANNLINGIQELRDAGAEAIEINDTVRVIAQTAVRDAPTGGVFIDGEQITAPYVIEAIGAPQTLAGALDILRGFTDQIERVNGKVTVEEEDGASIEISSVREPAPADYASPVPTE
jgi:uncharacterized protein YlxW (UPF0749 family)